jgi:CubicO group peptidase (beta-lactamase class C family)
MKSWTFLILGAFAAAGALAADTTLPDPKEMLQWDQATRVVGFRNTYQLYPGSVLHHGATPFPLPEASHKLDDAAYRLDGHDFHLADYLANQSVTGLLILKDGKVAFDYYGRGNDAQTLWTSRSVAKSIVSVLVGMAIKDGSIKSVDDPITDYIPELKKTAWDGVTLQNLLQHTSGTAWTENYADPASDFAKLTQCEAGPAAYDCIFALISTLPRAPGVKPGQRWSYNTGGAWLVGRVLERATGLSIANYFEKKVWQPFGMEHDGVWQSLEPDKVDFGGHGFNATLRDWGRFAQFVLRDGHLSDGTALLPADWIRRSTDWTKAERSVTPATPDGTYGYQWWFGGVDPTADSAPKTTGFSSKTFWAEGIYGQAIAINPAEHLAMVQWSVWQQAEKPDSLYDEQVLFFNAVANRLRAR